MRTGKVLLAAAAIASLLALSSVNVFADGNVQWAVMSQAQRNQEIVWRAWQDIGKSGGECKEWVQNKVAQASYGHVWLPLNNPSPDYYWVYDPHQHAIWMSMSIESAQPGNVIQMHLKSTNGPHTAIVYAVNSSGMTLIESNFWNHDGIVHVRTVSFSDFKTQVSAYTVYPIH